MANIRRFDPFGDLARFDPMRDLADYWRAPAMRAFWKGFPPEPDIKLDVTEDDKTYRVKADVPV